MSRWERASQNAVMIGDGTKARLARERARIREQRARSVEALIRRTQQREKAPAAIRVLDAISVKALEVVDLLEEAGVVVQEVPGFWEDFESVDRRFVNALESLTILRARLRGCVDGR